MSRLFGHWRPISTARATKIDRRLVDAAGDAMRRIVQSLTAGAGFHNDHLRERRSVREKPHLRGNDARVYNTVVDFHDFRSLICPV